MRSRKIQITKDLLGSFLHLKERLAFNKFYKTLLQHKKKKKNLLWLKTNGEAVFNIIVINFVRVFL